MKIIDTNSLLSQNDKTLLKHLAAESFHVGKFSSLDDILQQLNVDVIIEPGIPVRPISSALEDAETYWRQMLDVDPSTARQHLEEIWKDKENWSQMYLRGLYDPQTNIIKLYPEEMQIEYDGKKMKELLVSTLAHETMHAYFNRPGHDMFPYAIFVEEPLAEFGMLLYLYETGSNYYNWAYQDVSNKKTCYRYGAQLMGQYSNGNGKLRYYLENYKIALNTYTIPDIQNGILQSLPGLYNLSSEMNIFDNIPIGMLDLVEELKRMISMQAYYETKGNIYLLFGIVYANHIANKGHAHDILINAGLPMGQAQRIMDGVGLGKIMRKNNML